MFEILSVDENIWTLCMKVDPIRKDLDIATGIYVRAKDGDDFSSVDISWLDKESMLLFLRSRGGRNPWAENVVGLLLGYGLLVRDDDNKA